jgi:hypothetical protein
VARPVGQGELGAVGIEARTEVDRAVSSSCVISASLPYCVTSCVQVVEHRGRRGQLGGVDVAVGPERRLVGGGAGGDVGDVATQMSRPS